MVQLEVRSDGDEFDIRLHGRWRSLLGFVGRLSALVGAMTGLVAAFVAFGHAVGWW